MITLYTAQTPNGRKVSIALEEMGLAYEVRAMRLAARDQKRPEFLTINPNGRIPALVDSDTGAAVFESGACLEYLAEKSGQLMPQDLAGKYEVLGWVYFQVGGVGPAMAVVNTFLHYAKFDFPPAIERYQTEVRRLYGVLNTRLGAQAYLAGDYSIADITNYTWVKGHDANEIGLDDFPHLQRWLADIDARPAVKRGWTVPGPDDRLAFPDQS